MLIDVVASTFKLKWQGSNLPELVGKGANDTRLPNLSQSARQADQIRL